LFVEDSFRDETSIALTIFIKVFLLQKVFRSLRSSNIIVRMTEHVNQQDTIFEKHLRFLVVNFIKISL